MEINGVAHTFITAADFEATVASYRRLLPFLGMTISADTPTTFHSWGGRAGSGGCRAKPGRRCAPSNWGTCLTSG